VSPRPPAPEEAAAGAWSILAAEGDREEARAVMGNRSVAEVVELPRRTKAVPGTGRGGILEIATPGGRDVILKVLRKGGLGARARGSFHGRARLLAEMGVLAEAVRRGVPCAPVAFGATARMKDGRLAAVLATEKIPEAVTLGEILVEPAASAASSGDRREALARAGNAVRACHDRGLDHADLNLGNVLVSIRRPPRAPGAWVIDLGVSKLGSPLTPSQRAANLVRLLRSVEKHLGRDPRRLRDALAFFRGYVGRGGGDARRDLRRDLVRSIKKRLPAIALHRIGWSLAGRGGRARPRRS